ncbi:LPS export ABC transporter periplasmic protein LptC [Kordiimonas sp. SCSIO 12603]|uniref:LPS export ABC transporter periplasmic protein LptC n=1 Tax=Kordiimonas sp. SCSIO 12603 TaxID=2829596 RepID=UPI002107FAC6|nr:LPS export ABC transporter periplasmic protein LptC [Kordiimonas sp. SCSIO 12603]UTW59169.1 LPS export ABC transporter periplasmic protein LptC [Kordiimonas sp. SCSIO 12603]
MVKPTADHYHSTEEARAVARDALRPMARQATSPLWDKFIRTMQLVLPVTAAVLGTVTILWPYLNDNEVSFTLSTEDVAKGDSTIRMMKMRYVGTDAVNQLFEVEAASGQQDSPTAPRISLSDIKAKMTLEETGPATVTARTGIYRTKESTLSLVGGVNLITGNGFTLNMAGAEIDLKTHIAVGQGSITGQSDLGTLEAARMEIFADEREGIFDGGVKMHIVPKRPVGNKTTSEK